MHNIQSFFEKYKFQEKIVIHHTPMKTQ